MVLINNTGENKGYIRTNTENMKEYEITEKSIVV